MDVSQVRISQIEHAQDWYLSTLSSYVAALGGRLKLVAEFDDEAIELPVPSLGSVESGFHPGDGAQSDAAVTP